MVKKTLIGKIRAVCRRQRVAKVVHLGLAFIFGEAGPVMVNTPRSLRILTAKKRVGKNH